MGQHEEPLDRGLNTILDPAFLMPGQISDAKNAVLFPKTKALHRATGRASFGAASGLATNVVGLRDITFDNGNRYLIAHATASYVTAAVGDTGTFGVLASAVGVGSQLEAAHFRNRFYLMNGVAAAASAIGSNTVAYLSATGTSTPLGTRQHGMLGVKDAPAYSTAAGTFSQGVTGYYEYWTTEVAKLSADGVEFAMESSFEGDPATIFVETTATVPTISMPPVRNPITTHWRIYRSPKKDEATDKVFPAGFMIADMAVATGTNTHSDTYTVTTTTATLASGFNASPNPYSDCGTGASALGTDGGAVATLTIPSGTPTIKAQGVYNFAIGAFSGAIRGITVEVKAYVASGTAPCPVTVTIGRRQAGGDFNFSTYNPGFGFDPIKIYQTASRSGTITSTSSGSPTTLTLGGTSDRWFSSPTFGMTDNDFNSNALMVMISASKPGVTLAIDYMKLSASYGASIDSTIPYPTVIYTYGDISSQVGRNGTPPSSSTGDFYEDSFVVNDVTNPGVIKYSYPGDPEAFPGTYYLDFETRENDQVRLIKVVNSVLVVGLDSSIWRVNYLPSETDANFDRGKATQAISRRFGVVNPMCAAVYSPTGGPERLAFVSHKGIHSTNGAGFDTLTEDLDWRGVISLTSTSNPIALVDDPENECLRFFYRNDANGNETYLMLLIHYDEEPVRISGPVHMRNYDSGSGGTYASLESAWTVPRSNGGTSLYLGYGGSSTAAGAGKVYLETGTTIPANDSAMQFTTRRLYLAGMGSEFRLDNLHGYAGSYTGAPVVSYTAKTTKTGDAGETTQGTKSVTLGGSKLHRVNFANSAEGLRLSCSITASAYGVQQLLLDGTGFGEEDSGR